MEFNKCPYCNKEIESDSLYCDQCGQELRICTHGHGFKRGKICSECGKPLILAKDVSHTKAPTKQQTVEPKHLVNNTLNARLQLLDGAVIGRRTGNYVDVFGSQGYVSGSHHVCREAPLVSGVLLILTQPMVHSLMRLDWSSRRNL